MDANMRTYSTDADLVSLRRDQIARTATKLLSRHGYDRISVRQIANACDMAVGNIYHYVGSKEDILLLVIDRGVTGLAEFYNQVFKSLDNVGPTAALQQAIEKHYRIVDKEQDLLLFMYQETKNLPPSAQKSIFEADNLIVSGIEKILTRGCESGEFKIEDVKLVAHNIIALGHMWPLRRWFIKRHLVITIDEYIRQQTSLIFMEISTGPQ